MNDRFDYETYWEMVDRLRTTHRPVRFADVDDRFPNTPFFILRHDVDYSIDAAVALAEQESARGVHASYFLLPNGLYYNLLDPAHARVPRRLIELGHEVGLHYDVSFLYRFPSDRWPELVRLQAGILETLSGATVRSIAMHQPGLNGDDPLRGTTAFLNAYDDRFIREMPYVSDSCRAWRDSAWRMLNSGDLPPRFQLALHPINWAEADRDRVTIFRALHREIATSIEAAGAVLLEQISRHGAVLEHDARTRRHAAAGGGPAVER